MLRMPEKKSHDDWLSFEAGAVKSVKDRWEFKDQSETVLPFIFTFIFLILKYHLILVHLLLLYPKSTLNIIYISENSMVATPLNFLKHIIYYPFQCIDIETARSAVQVIKVLYKVINQSICHK